MANPNSPGRKLFAASTALLGLACLAAASLSYGQSTPAATSTAPATATGPGGGRMMRGGGRGGVPSPFAAQPPVVPMAKTYIDFFLPLPINEPLSKTVWGAAEVGPREQVDGLEDKTMKEFAYWDGQIIKAKDGKYHMFSSRWPQTGGHGAWPQSVAVHSVSDNVIGPYIDKGMCWPDDLAGKGHNVTALVLPGDEGFAVVVSETRPTPDVYTSKSLDGPWVKKGTIQGGVQNSNISIMLRPDGDFEIVPRNGHVYIAQKADGILGPYKDMTNGSIFPAGQQYPNMEDPCVFYAGGCYQVIVNSWSTRKAYHLTSKDGINNWVNRGLAYDPTTNFVHYTDGTVNHWAIMERPGVLVEDGHVTHMTLASINVQKNQDRGNDQNGSKILVLPFDGAKFDAELARDYAAEDAAKAAAPAAPPVTAPAR